MNLTDEILRYLETNNMFGQHILVVKEKAFKEINKSYMSRGKITKALYELEQNGQLYVDKGGIVRSGATLQEGVFYKVKNGHGMVAYNNNGKIEQLFVHSINTLQAANKSTVQFKIDEKDNGERTARVVSVTQAEQDRIYGVVKKGNDGKFQFIADDSRFKNGVDLEQNAFAAKAEQKRACATVLYYDPLKPSEKPLVKIENDSQIFGFVINPMATVQSLFHEYGVTVDFPQHVLDEVASIPTSVSPADLKGRLDLRHLQFITIDPATCKDKDDAIFVEPMYINGLHVGYRKYVAISDVSHYVKEDSELDKEAFNRGTSRYVAGTVAAMFPEKLSNGICSLHSNVDRLVMVTIEEIGLNGVVSRYDVKEAVINSKRSFAYEEITALHNGEGSDPNEFKEFMPLINHLYDLNAILAKNAKKRGALSIPGSEGTIILNETKDKVKDIVNENHVDSHKIVEHQMVGNNQVIAQSLNKLGIKNILRVHDLPSETRFEFLLAKLFDLGLDIPLECDSRGYQKLLEEIADRKESKVYSSQVVRSMAKAEYGTDEKMGHFALALDDYCHFTSPIRRYPDLIQHRLIKKAVELTNQICKENGVDTEGKMFSELIDTALHYGKNRFERLSDPQLENKCFHLNRCEENADELEQKGDQVCATLYMQERLGNQFHGYISGITKDCAIATVYDENDPLHSHVIDVTIPLSDLNPQMKNYVANETLTRAVPGRGTGHIFTVGDEVDFKIMLADPNTRIILATCDLQKELNPNNQEAVLEKTKK